MTSRKMLWRLNHEWKGDRVRLQEAEKKWDEDQRLLSSLQKQSAELQNQITQRRGRVDQTQSRHNQLMKELSEVAEQHDKFAIELTANSTKRNELLAAIDTMSSRERKNCWHKNRVDRINSPTVAMSFNRTGIGFIRYRMKLQSHESENKATISNIERMNQQNTQFRERQISLNEAIEKAIEPVKSLQAELQQLLESRRSSEKRLGDSQQTVSELEFSAGVSLNRLETIINNMSMRRVANSKPAECRGMN